MTSFLGRGFNSPRLHHFKIDNSHRASKQVYTFRSARCTYGIQANTRPRRQFKRGNAVHEGRMGNPIHTRTDQGRNAPQACTKSDAAGFAPMQNQVSLAV